MTMKKSIQFTKISAAANDFILIDNRKAVLKKNLKKCAQILCNRKNGIGADGLIIIELSRKADFKMRIFNPDGSEAEMCGNGARACALFAYENEIAGGMMCFTTLAGVIEARVLKDGVSIRMVAPSTINKDIKITHEDKIYSFDFVDTGVPHAVHFNKNIKNIDVKTLGKHVRQAKEFQPHGTNVNFAKIIDKHAIEVRTYERGVEDETLACGTGSTASALVAGERYGCLSPIKVLVQSGDYLTISFKRTRDNSFENICMKGPAKEIFVGTLSHIL